MKNWIKKHFMRLWLSGLAGMGLGFVCELIYGSFSKDPVNGLVMLFIIGGGAVGAWYILVNNNDFKK